MSARLFLLCGFLCFFVSCCSASSKYVTRNEGTGRPEIHHGAPGANDPWISMGFFKNQINETGWSFLNLSTNGAFPDEMQAYFAGYLEAYMTADDIELIQMHWTNTVKGYCSKPYSNYCQKLKDFLEENYAWMQDMIAKLNTTDPYWHQVDLLLQQVQGLQDAYDDITGRQPKGEFDVFGLYLFQVGGDLEDLEGALHKPSRDRPIGSGSCSALIKLTADHSELFVAHDTWSTYQSMLRILKKYEFNITITTPPLPPGLKSTQTSYEVIPGRTMTFSSYPGTLMSGDDYYLMSSGVLSMETTIGNANPDLWKYIHPRGGVLEGIRSMVANRLTTSGPNWAKIFKRYNSGTYNNQWMIVDYGQFSPGSVGENVLTVLEQIPGTIEFDDFTDVLLVQGYWPSYNIPYFKDIFNKSGGPGEVAKYGPWFSYNGTSRAKMFKRDQGKVTDFYTMIQLMRYNDFKNDPLARCNCTPPYSAENGISARSDLNPASGKYPFGALAHRSHGATDMKVTNHKMFQDLSFIAISSPTYEQQPPFQWSKFDLGKNISHVGQPDLFKFSDVIFNGVVP